MLIQLTNLVGKKIPVSVLVVIYSPNRRFLVLERADKPGYWQSVTGSLDTVSESPFHAAVRELFEETGIQAVADEQCGGLFTLSEKDHYALNRLRTWPHQTQYEIMSHWLHRYPNGITHNTEHWFFVCIAQDTPVQINPREHLQHAWLDAEQASAVCFSPSNAMAIRVLSQQLLNA